MGTILGSVLSQERSYPYGSHIARRAKREAEREAALVFPSIRSTRKPLSENAMNSALRRMGYTKEEMCAHGFRSSASTVLNERGHDRDVIEVALAHQDENETRAAYNRAKYWPQRVTLLQDWADLLDEFRTLSASGNDALAR
jgi:integrase